ncbi:MAG: hypothetical protein ACJ8ER_05025 [Allosphingosinicella sp.]
MRNFIVLAASAASLLGTAPAIAKSEGAKPAKVHMVCRISGDSTSRISRTRTCHSKEEWAQIDQERLRDTERGLDDTNHARQQMDTFRNTAAETAPRA